MLRLSIFRKNLILKVSAITLIFAISVSSITQFFLLPLPIFGFHSIYDQNKPSHLPSRASHLDYSLQNLEELLIYLIQHNYWFLSTQEFYDYFFSKTKAIPKEQRNNKPVMLTFDDGYKNIDVYLLPLLEKLQQEFNHPLKIVLFVNPKYMKRNDFEKKTQYLNCEDLKRGTELGFYDVQSHGYSHADLTRLKFEDLKHELSESQQALKTCLSNLPDTAQHIAYPYNKVNSTVEQLTAKYYQSAYLFKSRFRHLLFLINAYKIPRIGISKKDSPQTLIQLAKRYS